MGEPQACSVWRMIHTSPDLEWQAIWQPLLTESAPGAHHHSRPQFINNSNTAPAHHKHGDVLIHAVGCTGGHRCRGVPAGGARARQLRLAHGGSQHLHRRGVGVSVGTRSARMDAHAASACGWDSRLGRPP